MRATNNAAKPLSATTSVRSKSHKKTKWSYSITEMTKGQKTGRNNKLSRVASRVRQGGDTVSLQIVTRSLKSQDRHLTAVTPAVLPLG